MNSVLPRTFALVFSAVMDRDLAQLRVWREMRQAKEIDFAEYAYLVRSAAVRIANAEDLKGTVKDERIEILLRENGEAILADLLRSDRDAFTDIYLYGEESLMNDDSVIKDDVVRYPGECVLDFKIRTQAATRAA